jgi:hypothetical protein
LEQCDAKQDDRTGSHEQGTRVARPLRGGARASVPACWPNSAQNLPKASFEARSAAPGRVTLCTGPSDKPNPKG